MCREIASLFDVHVHAGGGVRDSVYQEIHVKSGLKK